MCGASATACLQKILKNRQLTAGESVCDRHRDRQTSPGPKIYESSALAIGRVVVRAPLIEQYHSKNDFYAQNLELSKPISFGDHDGLCGALCSQLS